jgi:hypothetical protein
LSRAAIAAILLVVGARRKGMVRAPASDEARSTESIVVGAILFAGHVDCATRPASAPLRELQG